MSGAKRRPEGRVREHASAADYGRFMSHRHVKEAARRRAIEARPPTEGAHIANVAEAEE